MGLRYFRGICVALHLTPALTLSAQAVDTATALAGLRDARAACAQDAGVLWGRSLCGPIALVDRQTRLVLASDSVPARNALPYAGAFVTTLPAGMFIANTSFQWGGRPWAMIALPLPTDRFDRVALVMHEVFHREQATLGLGGEDPANNQLDLLDGRRWFRLELRALASALEALAANASTVRAHTEDALLFRARRRSLYPLADSLEPALEMQEGLAEYTGDRLAMAQTGETAARVARRVRDFQSNPTFVRSFAYATGPALGLLLDHFAPGWRDEIRSTRDPARLLARHLPLVVPGNLAREANRRAQRYDVASIDREEKARDSIRAPTMARYRARLVDGLVVALTQTSLSRNFDPLSLVGYDITHTIYPTGTFTADWGSLEVTDGGALVSNDFRRIQVGAPITAAETDRVVKGDGWVLTLKPGWRIVASERGYTVVNR
jgi:hypothetical protein